MHLNVSFPQHCQKKSVTERKISELSMERYEFPSTVEAEKVNWIFFFFWSLLIHTENYKASDLPEGRK